MIGSPRGAGLTGALPACHQAMRLESIQRDRSSYIDVCNDLDLLN
ncbi:MAG: hypothetical protein AB8G17_13850 [Gammaproteobacteria bacterium]